VLNAKVCFGRNTKDAPLLQLTSEARRRIRTTMSAGSRNTQSYEQRTVLVAIQRRFATTIVHVTCNTRNVVEDWTESGIDWSWRAYECCAETAVTNFVNSSAVVEKIREWCAESRDAFFEDCLRTSRQPFISRSFHSGIRFY